MMMSKRSTKVRGFSLIELVIVLLIIAILSAIAIPSYRQYVVRANRVDAQRSLMDLAARQERFFYSRNGYASALSDLGANSSIAGANYTIAPPSATSTAFTITASAVGSQQKSDQQCQTLTITNTGVQGSTGSTANDPKCWSK
jgi:type IV pilus assembly protein PilE